jgi:transcriptional regulator with XRE-family HTH domain
MENTDKLKDLATSGRSSEWMELKAYKKQNRKWLDRSMDIALRILEVLDEKAMSQSKLAEEMKVSRQYVSTILRGTENLSLETISKFEDTLGVDLLEVTGKKEEIGDFFRASEVKKLGYFDVNSLSSYDYQRTPLIPYCQVNVERSLLSAMRKNAELRKVLSGNDKCLMSFASVPSKPVITYMIHFAGDVNADQDQEKHYALGI